MVEICQEKSKMAPEADDLKQVRDQIRKLYDMSKKVIVAPCKCKLYISRFTEIIDFEGKTSPNWFYFASGVTTIVFDPQTNELMLTLFDTTNIRLLWMLKITDKTHIYAPNSSFHVINTRDDLSEHVGFLYESKEVASLLLNTFSLLTSQLFESRFNSTTKNEDLNSNDIEPLGNPEGPRADNLATTGKKRRGLFRSLTFHIRRRSHSSKRSVISCHLADTNDANQLNNGDFINAQQRSREAGGLEVSTLDTQHCNERKTHGSRRRRSSGRSKTVGPESIPCLSSLTNTNLIRHVENKGNKRSSVPCFVVGEVEDIFPSRETITAGNRRSISSRGGTSQMSIDRAVPQEAASSTKPDATDGQKRGSIFRRTGKKISRSLSEKLPNRPHVTLRREKQIKDSDEELCQGQTTCNCQPRASSDSLLLKGNTIDCMVETGHMAKYQRERKCWMTILENETVLTTDLCVTEL